MEISEYEGTKIMLNGLGRRKSVDSMRVFELMKSRGAGVRVRRVNRFEKIDGKCASRNPDIFSRRARHENRALTTSNTFRFLQPVYFL